MKQKQKQTIKQYLLIILATSISIIIINLPNKIEAYDNKRAQTSYIRMEKRDSILSKKNTDNKNLDRLAQNRNTEIQENPLCSLDAVICPDEKQGTIESLIAHYSDIYNFNLDTALRIADCESKTGKYLYNFSGSSAKGIYQFTDGTWKNYCKGDVLNADDNIKCFMKLYNQHPQWWECV